MIPHCLRNSANRGPIGRLVVPAPFKLSLTIPVPSMEMQNRLCDLLDLVPRAKQKWADQLELVDGLIPSMIARALGQR